jgi:hypothetical protein
MYNYFFQALLFLLQQDRKYDDVYILAYLPAIFETKM